MPFCQDCGREHRQEAKFCPGCGRSLQYEQPANQPVTPGVQPASEPTPPAIEPPSPPKPAPPLERVRYWWNELTTMQKILVIGAAFFAGILLAAIYPDGDSPDPGPGTQDSKADSPPPTLPLATSRAARPPATAVWPPASPTSAPVVTERLYSPSSSPKAQDSKVDSLPPTLPSATSRAAQPPASPMSAPVETEMSKNGEPPSEIQIFEDSQGRKEFYMVYVPPVQAGSDRLLYDIAIAEYPGRGSQLVIADFFEDADDAEAAACYEAIKGSNLSKPCNGKTSVEYPSHVGFVALGPEVRFIYRSFADPLALDAKLDSWDVERPPRTLAEINSPVWNVINVPVITVDFDVGVLPGTDSSTYRLCTDAYSVYKLFAQRKTDQVDILTIHFLMGDENKIRRLANTILTSREPQTRISIRPYHNQNRYSDRPDFDQANITVRLNGPWDSSSPPPTCQME